MIWANAAVYWYADRPPRVPLPLVPRRAAHPGRAADDAPPPFTGARSAAVAVYQDSGRALPSGTERGSRDALRAGRGRRRGAGLSSRQVMGERRLDHRAARAGANRRQAPMRKLNYSIVDVFTTRPLTGNALAVFTNAAATSRRQRMQALARELNLSETTFMLPPEHDATARVRIFTPRSPSCRSPATRSSAPRS